MHRIVIGDSPTESLSDTDPVVHLAWIGGDAVECQTVLVGGIARAIRGELDRAGLPETPLCYGVLVPVTKFRLRSTGAPYAGDLDFDVARVGGFQRLLRTFERTWQQVFKRRAH